jgi:tetratricopeptide (TPR) repeat protein
MIVKNEAKNLPRCLGSVQGVVDEIVVVDTGSSDRTPEIAQQWGAQVHHFEWIDDFAAARNAALSYVQGDWVLVLDADELLTPEIKTALKQVIQFPNYLLVNLLRQEVGAAQSPFSLVPRLFRKHPRITFTRPYHETVDDSVATILKQESHWQMRYLPQVAIVHSGYQPETIAARQKATRARQIMEKYLSQHPEDPYICSKLGALYVQLGALKRGITLLEQGLQGLAKTPAAGLQLYELHYHLGIAYTLFPDPETAARHYQAAIQQETLPELKLGAYNNLGSLFKEQGQLAQAQAAYQTTIDIAPNFAAGHYNLGLTLKALNDFPGAIACYRRALELQPDYAEAHQNLGVVLFKLGRLQESLSAFNQAIAIYEQQGSPEAEQLREGVRSLGYEL